MRALLIFFCLGLMALVPAYFLTAMPSQETAEARIVADDTLLQDQKIESQLKAIRSQRP